MKRLLFLLPLLVAMAGCSTVTVSHEGGRDLCHISTSSWKLLNSVPIISGDINHPNEMSCVWFENTATPEGNMKILDKTLRDYNSTRIRTLTSYMTEETIFVVLFKRQISHLSVELLYDPPPTKEYTE